LTHGGEDARTRGRGTDARRGRAGQSHGVRARESASGVREARERGGGDAGGGAAVGGGAGGQRRGVGGAFDEGFLGRARARAGLRRT